MFIAPVTFHREEPDTSYAVTSEITAITGSGFVEEGCVRIAIQKR